MQFEIPNKTEQTETEFSILNENNFRLNLKHMCYYTSTQSVLKDLVSLIHL